MVVSEEQFDWVMIVFHLLEPNPDFEWVEYHLLRATQGLDHDFACRVHEKMNKFREHFQKES